MLLLWSLSVLVSAFALVIGITKQSWMLLLVSTITALPIAVYFFGVVNAWKYVSITPILLLLLTIVLYYNKRKNDAISL